MKGWLRVGVVSLVTGVMFAGFIVAGVAEDLTAEKVGFAAIGLTFLGVSSVLIVRVPENRVSWALLGATIGLALVPFWFVLEVLLGVGLFGITLPSLAVLVPLWFPTGRSLARWGWVVWACAVGVVGIFGGALLEAIQGGADFGEEIDACTSLGSCISILGLGSLLIATAGAAASLILRWTRSTGTERQQLKWIVPPFTVFGIGVLASFGGLEGSIVADLSIVGLLLIPLSISFAILRYRLYEIDRIISRTVSYALVVGFLGLVYGVGAVWLPSRLAGDSQLFVAGSTITVAALFNPVRKRIHGLVDRRFNRSRYDAERVMTEFARSLRDRIDPEGVVDDWVGVVSATMQPSSISVWVRKS